MNRRRLLNKHFCIFFPNISIETEKNANLHFSHYKPMGTIIFHSNQSSYLTGIKYITFRSPYLKMLCVYINMERIGLTASEDLFGNLNDAFFRDVAHLKVG